MQNQKICSGVGVKKLPNSEVEITAEISAESLETFRAGAIAKLRKKVELPGFRKGYAPEKILINRLGELAVLEEAAGLALDKAYPLIIAEEKLDVIGAPKVTITKLAPKNPLVFKINVAVFPEFTLPDYRKIAKKVFGSAEPVLVTDKDVEIVINEIRKAKKDETGKEELPELTDDFVKSIGKFENVADFTEKVRGNLKKEKLLQAKEKIRLDAIKCIVEEAPFSVPNVLIEGELERMILQFKDDLKRMAVSIDDYLKRLNKTEEQLRSEWRGDAEGRVKFEIILGKIAEAEKITPAEEEVEREVRHIIEHHSGAKPERVLAYVSHLLKNEKVFEFLENQK